MTTRDVGKRRLLRTGALGLGLLLSAPALAEVPAPAPKAKEAAPAAAPKMEAYQLVLLRRGPRWTPLQTPEIERLQEQHLGHLTKMGESGKMVIAGPFSDQADQTLRGMCLYRVGSLEEARKLAEADPMVQAGRLRVEVLSWWVEKGYMTFPKTPQPR